MSANTISLNHAMTHFDNQDTLWLFGYGSLIYKVDFPFIERKPARIRHWARRFWQGSHDHRGTPSAPGRVVTLIESVGAVCEGMAYLITPEEFAHLDFREKNGYLRVKTEIEFADSQPKTAMGIVYVADEQNAAFLGPAAERDIALQIARSKGPSGKNSDYLFQLAQALRQLNVVDEHVFEIERQLIALNSA